MVQAAAALASGACPFCGQQIPRQIVAYGGKCPHCFAEIPGEEAATDPGVERGAAQVAAAAVKVQRTRRIPILLAGLLPLVLVAGAATVFFRPPPEIRVLNLDDAEYEMADVGNLVAYVEPVEGAASPERTPQTGRRPAGTRRAQLPTAGGAAALAQSVSTGGFGTGEGDGGGLRGTRAASQAGVAAAPEMTSVGSLSPIGAGSLDLGVNISRREHLGVQISDEDAIIDMIKSRLKAQLPKLRYCYDTALRTDDTLAGGWLLEFTVNPKGGVGDAQITGKDRTDGGLESCLLKELQGWKFDPIVHEQPVAKTANFRPN